ncbi:hypothetical protein C0J52_23065, partial [Blattella germanica]
NFDGFDFINRAPRKQCRLSSSGVGVHEINWVPRPQKNCHSQWVPGAMERSSRTTPAHQMNVCVLWN